MKISEKKQEKKQVVLQLKEEIFGSSAIVIVAHNHGLTVAASKKLRMEFKKAGCKFKVTKNSLTKIAAKGTPFESLSGVLVGPTSLAYADDPVSVAKLITEFSKTNEKLKIIGGVMDGKFMAPEEIGKLAMLPSLDQLRGNIVGLLQAPASKLACIMQVPASQVARVLKAYADKK